METSDEDDATITLSPNISLNASAVGDTGNPVGEPLPFALRSRCMKNCCVMGRGIEYRTRISPSPSKSRVHRRKRRPSGLALEVLEEDHATSLDVVVKKLNFLNSTYVNTDQEFCITQHDILTELETIPEPKTILQLRNCNGYSSLNTVDTQKYICEKNFNELDIELRNENKLHRNSPDSITNSFNAETPNGEHFVPATDFFAHLDTRDRFTSSGYSSGNDTPGKLRESTRRLSIRKSFNDYIAYSSDEELDEWWHQPKSDYTYSASLTYRSQVTPERKIGSPNMSRRGLRRTGSSTITTTFSSPELPYSSTVDNLALRSREIPRGGLDAFSDGSDLEESVYLQRGKSRLDRGHESSNSERQIKETFTENSIYRTTINYGLDAESDSDEAPSTPANHIAKSLIVRKGTTSSLRRGASAFSATSTSLNGGSNARLANHIHTSTTNGNSSSYSTSEKRGYGSYGSLERIEEMHNWKDLISRYYYVLSTFIKKFTSSTYTSVRSTIYMSILLMAAGISKSLKQEDISKLNHYDHKEMSHSSSMSTTTTTKTTVMSTTRTLITITENLMHFYKEKKKRNPWLWFWLPLLLLLLFLIPVYAYWLKQPIENEYHSFSYVPLKEPLTIWSIWRRTLKAISETFFFSISFLGEQLLQFFSALLNLLFICFSYLNYGLLIIYNALKFVVFWLLGFVTRSFSSAYDYLSFSQTTIGNNSAILADKFWTVTTSSVELISNGFSVAANNSWIGAGNLFSYMISSLSSVWNLMLWCFSGLWFWLLTFLSTLLSVIGSTAEVLLSGIVGATSKFILFVPLLFSKSEKLHDIPLSVTVSPSDTLTNVQSQHSIEDVVSLILENHQFKNYLTTILNEKMMKNDVTDRDISHLVRLAVETEVKAVKTEILDLSKLSGAKSSAAEEQILSIKDEQINLIQQLAEMQETLKSMRMSYNEDSEKSSEASGQFKVMLLNASANIEKLSDQLSALNKDHEALSLEVRACCRNSSLTLEDVERHVQLLVSDLIGMSPQESGKGDVAAVLKASRMGAWLNTYFVAKDEMETKLDSLVEKLQINQHSDDAGNIRQQQEAVQQTAHQVMDIVMQQIRSEMQMQQQEVKNKLEEIDNAASVATAKLKEISASAHQSLQEESILKKEGIIAIQADLDNRIEEAVHKVVVGSVSSTIAAQIKDTLKEELPVVVQKHVNAAVDGKVELAKEQINIIVKEQVSEIDNDLKQRISTLSVETLKVVNSEKETIENHQISDNSKLAAGIWASGGLNATYVKQIIKDALVKYDADKTGMVDHALESGGATIVSTRCTEGFQGHQAELTILGYSVYRYSTNTPRAIIQPDRMPGQCYAFKGSQGYIVIQFAGLIKITGYSVEHIPKALSPTGSIDSAPKNFSVYALNSTDEEGIMLGTYSYLDNGEPLQYFPVLNVVDEYFKYVELRVLNNHGNMQYTCLYRFRVHGVRKV